MKYLVEEMKGTAGVNETAVASEIVEADSEERAINRARAFYWMLLKRDEVMNGSGRFNHYLMATALDIDAELRRIGHADAVRVEYIGDVFIRLHDDHGYVQGRIEEIYLALVTLPDNCDWMK